jgi:hypothetical protein
MHATSFFALDRWRAAGHTGPGLRPATWAGQHRSGVALVISRHGDAATLTTIEAVLRRAGVEFIDENGGGPGVRLRKPLQGKQRK